MEEGDLHVYQKVVKRKSQTPPYMEDYEMDDPLRIGIRFNAEKLVSLVRARRPLYDYNSKDYYNKDIVDLLWREVSAEMNINVSEVKSKWMGLRNSYARCLRLRGSSDSSGRRKRRPWYLSNAMTFLNEFMGHNRHPRFESSQLDPFDDLTTRNSQYRTLILNEDGDSVPAAICDQITTTADSTDRRSVISPSPSITQHNPSTWSLPTDELNDPDLLFLRSMLPDIKKLSRKRRLEYKARIFSLLSDMIDEDERAAKSTVITVKEENDD